MCLFEIFTQAVNYNHIFPQWYSLNFKQLDQWLQSVVLKY